MELQSKVDIIKQLQNENSAIDELQTLVKMLKADLAAERQKSSELELEVHESQNNSEDLQRQLTMVRKKEGMLKQNLQEQTNELDKLKENLKSNGANNSVVQMHESTIHDLEQKVRSLQFQNDTLRKDNQDSLNSKYLEIENKLLQVERQNKSLLSQLEIEKSKNKKLLSDFEQMANMVKEAQAEKKELSERISMKKCDCEQ